MMHHAQIAQRAFNTPLMVEPAKALAFLSGLGPRIAGGAVSFAGFGDEVGAGGFPWDGPGADAIAEAARTARGSLIGGDLARCGQDREGPPYALVDGVAVIAIAGTLVHRGAWIGQSSGLTSCEGLAAQIDAAVADPAVRGIALEIDSFGGEVAGVFDLADRLRAARAVKPVQAFVAEHALSAGYALASQAHSITLPRTGAVGSIGVVALHAERSGELAQRGIAVTLIRAGARKTDGNPYEPLPDPVRAGMQAELEDLRRLFAETVAAGRGDRCDAAAALATEAAVFRGAAAVTAGLADAVADPRSAFRTFAEGLRSATAPVAVAAPRDLRAAAGADPLPPTGPKESLMPQDIPSTDPILDEVAPAGPDPDQSATANPAAPLAGSARETAGAKEATVTPAPSAAPSPAPAALAQSDVPGIVAVAGDGNSAAGSAVSAEAIRAEAAEVSAICAQAARLGVAIDVADAVRRGLRPDALRAKVLADLAARSDALAIVATAPAVTAPAVSPIVAAARRTAGDAQR